jgi:hypothetical protein
MRVSIENNVIFRPLVRKTKQGIVFVDRALMTTHSTLHPSTASGDPTREGKRKRWCVRGYVAPAADLQCCALCTHLEPEDKVEAWEKERQVVLWVLCASIGKKAKCQPQEPQHPNTGLCNFDLLGEGERARVR